MYTLCADLHLHNWAQFSRPDERGINTRLTSTLDVFRDACALAAANCSKRVYIAGDVFHERGWINPSVLNPTLQVFDDVTKTYELEVRILPGNHDLASRECDWLGSSIVALGELDRVTITHEPTVFDDDRVVLVPWVERHEKLALVIQQQVDDLLRAGLKPGDYDLILHTGVEGVLSGVHGWQANELEAYGFRNVFTGHYHHHCALGTKKSVVSIGALTHQTWSDVDTLAGWLDVEDDSYSFIESQAPKFMDFDTSSTDLTPYAGNYVRVRGLTLEQAEIRAMRDAIMDAGALGVSMEVAAKSNVIPRSGAIVGKSITLESSVAAFVQATEVDRTAAVHAAAINVLAQAKAQQA